MSIHSSSEMTAQTARAQSRQTLRYIAAALCAVTALLYALIGFRVLTVLDGGADQTWGLAPAAAYALGAVLLIAYDRRLLWIVGAILQVFVIYTYFNLAAQRAPAFEVWGLVIRVIQALILVTLIYLEVRLPLKQSNDDSPGAREPLKSHG